MLFQAGELDGVLLSVDDVVMLQEFFDENPAYFLAVSGRPAAPDAASEQLSGQVPPEFSYSKQFSIGFIDRHQRLLGVADVVSDLMTAGAWHIGLFMITTEQHGCGLGFSLYQALAAWIEDQGARWIRLGVVVGNSVAERFWARQQFIEVRMRHGVLMDGKLNDVRVMVKPLRDNLLSDYRVLMPRDQAGAS